MYGTGCINRSPELTVCILEYSVRKIFPDDRTVSRDYQYIHPIHVPQFTRSIRNRSTHPRHFRKQQEQILICNRRHRTILLRHLEMFLHLQRLMLSTSQLHSRHHSSRTAVKQPYLFILRHDVFFLFCKKHMRTKCQCHMPLNLKILPAIEVINAEILFCVLHSLSCQPDLLLFYFIIPVFFQSLYEEVCHFIQIGLYSGRAGYD